MYSPNTSSAKQISPRPGLEPLTPGLPAQCPNHYTTVACLNRGHRYYLDTILVRKISKRHFLKDIENSFQEVTQIGPEPPHFFSFSNISTNRVARDFQNFGRNGP